MEIARKLLIIYFHNPNCLKRVSNFGNLIYHSNKLNYAYMYIDEKKLKSTIDSIKQIHGVTNVEVSLTEMEDYKFSL